MAKVQSNICRCHLRGNVSVYVVGPEDLYDVAFQSDVIHLKPYKAALGNFIVYDGDPSERS